MDLQSFIFASDCKIYAQKNIKKGALKIFPFGSVQRLKPKQEDEKEKLKAPKVVVKVLQGNVEYQIMQPKFNVEKASGAIPIFHWVGNTEEDDLANLQLHDVKFESWLSIPCYKNGRQIAAGEQLLCLKEKAEEKGQPPKKKAKKA